MRIAPTTRPTANDVSLRSNTRTLHLRIRHVFDKSVIDMALESHRDALRHRTSEPRAVSCVRDHCWNGAATGGADRWSSETVVVQLPRSADVRTNARVNG